MPKEISVGDETKKLYSTTEIAEDIDRTAQTIRLWERKGIIPKAPHIAGVIGFSKQGKRYYSLKHKTALRLLVQKHKVMTGIKMPEAFITELKESFNDIANNKTPNILTDVN